MGTAVLEKLAELDVESISPETARTLLQFRIDDSHQSRVAALGEKSQAGTLTPDERAEYSEYVHVGDVLAILMSKARQVLKTIPGNP